MLDNVNSQASQSDISALVGVLVEGGVTSYLEIGARHGDTFGRIVRSLPKIGFYVSVSGDTDLIDCVESLQSDGYNAHYVLGDSANSEVLELIGSLGDFDAVMIRDRTDSASYCDSKKSVLESEIGVLFK